MITEVVASCPVTPAQPFRRTFSMQIIDNFVRHEYGVEIITDTPVTGLTVEDGKVCGFTATSSDGTIYQVKANAVILATGGYIMNNDLYAEYQPDDMKFPRTGPFWADGSGMLMARDDAGAAWCCMDMGVTCPCTPFRAGGSGDRTWITRSGTSGGMNGVCSRTSLRGNCPDRGRAVHLRRHLEPSQCGARKEGRRRCGLVCEGHGFRGRSHGVAAFVRQAAERNACCVA